LTPSMLSDVTITLVSDRAAFLEKVGQYERMPEIFIDIETAEWWTSSPRVALLQVWDGREVSVFDVLAPGMSEVLRQDFVPRIMANEQVKKWAHNASYEKRFLGGAAAVKNLACTLRLARGLAYHRLPTESLSLASLVNALFNVPVDKTLQKADWSERPLRDEHIRYAAADTTWCAQLRTALEAIERPPRPEDDDPEEIDAAFQALQIEMDETIRARLDDTRKQLFEHFDEEVHQRVGGDCDMIAV